MRQHAKRPTLDTQQGAAVIVALFIVVLCALAVSPLIWTIFASAKTVSVDATRDQAELVAHSGLDWARVILREDARVSSTDTLTEPWAVPLAESNLGEGLMRKTDHQSTRNAWLQGAIEDAQGRFNLRNLGLDNASRSIWLKAFEKLCDLLKVEPEQVALIEQTLAKMYAPNTPAPDKTDAEPRWIAAQHWNEFRNRYSISESTWQQLRPYVTLLPTVGPVNVNTCSAEVLYAVVDKLGFSQAQGVLAQRERASFRSLADVQSAVGANIAINNSLITLNSRFFLVEGSAQVDLAVINTVALLERRDQHVYVIWRQ